MRFTARAAALATAVAFARRSADERAELEILQSLLVCADGDRVEITGHSLDYCHTTTCAATLAEAGAAAVPADSITALIGAMPGHLEVTIASTGNSVRVSVGESHYRLPELPARNFPTLLTPGCDATAFSVSQADITALLVKPAIAVSNDLTRLHLCGVYLHTIDGRLAAAATDGIKLVHRVSQIEARTPRGIIIPTPAIIEIARLARHKSVALATDGRIIEARCGTARFASKLIDCPFPEYARLLPPPAATAAVFDSAEMGGALARLAAVSGRHDDRAAVGLTWGGGNTLSLCLANEDGTASDTVAATTSGSARVACSAGVLTGLIGAIGAKRVRISIEDRPGAVLRLDAPGDRGVVAIVAPIYWAAKSKPDAAAA